MSESEETKGPYDHRAIERRWQKEWNLTGLYEVDLENASAPFYNLMMFPYPSAEGLHVGNVYAFIGADIYGRFSAMQGMDVFEPIGFDAFGIHSENFAIKKGVHPKALTARNVDNFRTQLQQIGNRFDWRHDVNTTDPAYYKWSQWIFLQLYNAGLAVRKEAPVNWCPSCQTVLADEQVIDGACERCDTTVVQRNLKQWFFTITAYAQRLLDNLDELDWSERIKTAQRNWIGRSEGLEFTMQVAGRDDTEFRVFTTRPDTLFGVTYVVLAPEHPLVDAITTAEHRADIDAYRESMRRTTEFERVTQSQAKSGVFTGAHAIHPVTNEQLPIWIAEYVLMSYGTGAIMAVPAHDERDFAFATEFDLPVQEVIVPGDEADQERPSSLEEAYTDTGVLVNSGPFSGVTSEEAIPRIIAWFEERDRGRGTVEYRLRDWLISRQRYWGPPIPIMYCAQCGTVPVPEDDLPVLLPDVEDWMPTGTGVSPLAKISAFVETQCPECGKAARRETDVSDNFLDSAWYFLRYPSTDFDDRPFDKIRTAKWLPVDMYIGGPEHAVLHLLYSRFITMALHDLGFTDFEEPFRRFRAHGHITKDGAKMSKSRGNVVNPDDYIEQVGADTLRTYLMFLGPYEQGGDFTDEGMSGVTRFLNRVWDLLLQHQEAGTLLEQPLPVARQRRAHQAIHKVTEDIGRLKYNTAIAALMEYLNTLRAHDAIYAEEARTFLTLLAPFAPHITEEVWERLGGQGAIHEQRWPEADPELLVAEQVTIAIQIDGQTRATLDVAPDASEEEVLTTALQIDNIQRYVTRDDIKRVVYVPGRVINMVT